MEYDFDLQALDVLATHPFGRISSCRTYGISEGVKQPCAEVEQSQAENLEKALVVVPKGWRWI